MTWTIRVQNWREFQHYKDRDPPWIKLHQRRLLDKPSWRRLHGSAAKLLVDLWMLAAGTKEGELDLTVSDLAYRLRAPAGKLASDLRVLAGQGFLALGKQMLADASTAQADDAPERETEGEGERETTKSNTVATPPEGKAK